MKEVTISLYVKSLFFKIVMAILIFAVAMLLYRIYYPVEKEETIIQRTYFVDRGEH